MSVRFEGHGTRQVEFSNDKHGVHIVTVDVLGNHTVIALEEEHVVELIQYLLSDEDKE